MLKETLRKSKIFDNQSDNFSDNLLPIKIILFYITIQTLVVTIRLKLLCRKYILSNFNLERAIILDYKSKG